MVIRPAEPEDALAVARVHVRSWQAAYRNLMPDDYLDQLRPEDRAQKYDFANADPSRPQTLVALEGGIIQGFATIAPYRGPELKDWGEVCALYVDPQHWNGGIGSALVAAARARLLEHRFSSAALWVLEGNTRAERFYQRDGWTPDGTRRIDQVWNVTVNEVRYLRALVDS